MNLQVIEDFQDTLDLETMLVSLNETRLPSETFLRSVNRALGAWLRSFHTWSAALEQSNLRKEVWKNEPMRRLKLRITYDVFIKVVENFPDILQAHQKTLEEVKEMGVKEFAREPSEDEGMTGESYTGTSGPGSEFVRGKSIEACLNTRTVPSFQGHQRQKHSSREPSTFSSLTGNLLSLATGHMTWGKWWVISTSVSISRVSTMRYVPFRALLKDMVR